MKNYSPKPIDTSDVKLSKELIELSEAIAENAHDIWAEKRIREGWTYGPERNDRLKQTPDMIPYSELPESEKEYDRGMAIRTIKLLRKLGYDIIKIEDSELYNTLMKHIRNTNTNYICRHCLNEKNIITPIKRGQPFCEVCGCKIDHELYQRKDR